MPVHLFGPPAPLAELAALGLPLIEDAAQAFGAAGVASTGVCSTFSFFPTKNLFALGDGGLIACRDDEVAERVRMLRFHGSRDKQTFELVGTNSRLDAIQAAALRVFLPHLKGWNDGRREGPRATRSSGSARPSTCRSTSPGHVYHMYVVRTPERARIAAALKEAGIASASYYVTPLHLQPAMRTSATSRARCPRPSGRRGEPRAADVGRHRRVQEQERSSRRVRDARVRRRLSRSRRAHPVQPTLALAGRGDAASSRRRGGSPGAPLRPGPPGLLRPLPRLAIVLVVVAIKLPSSRSRLLQPLVALRLDARHVGGLRGVALASLAVFVVFTLFELHPAASRAASGSSTCSSASRSSRARACSRGR
jgi:hypothetical protein